MTNINLNIERLILEGIDLTPHDRKHLQAAVEAELARLLATDELSPELQAGGAVPSVKAGNIQMASDSNPNQLGQQIAQAVHGGIGR